MENNPSPNQPPQQGEANQNQDQPLVDNSGPQSLAPEPDNTVSGVQQQPIAAEENPDKSYLVALFLSYFLGSLGADRFYLEKIGTGILKLLTFGGFGIWHAVDLLLVAFNKMHAKEDNRPLEGYAHNRSWVKILAIVMIIFNVLVIAGIITLLVFTTFSGVQGKARNTERQTDLKATQGQLEAYFARNGYYPSLAQMNDSSFRAANLQGLDDEALKDPQGTQAQLSAMDMKGKYTYSVSPMNCDNQKLKCESYEMTAQMEGEPAFTVKSLN